MAIHGLIVGNISTLSSYESGIKAAIEAKGHTVSLSTVADGVPAVNAIWISLTANDAGIGDSWRDAEIPTIVTRNAWTNYELSTSSGAAAGYTKANVTFSAHVLAAGYTGEQTFLSSNHNARHDAGTRLGGSGVWHLNNTLESVMWAYEADEDNTAGFTVPDKRVAFGFLGASDAHAINIWAARTSVFNNVLDAIIDWVTPSVNEITHTIDINILERPITIHTSDFRIEAANRVAHSIDFIVLKTISRTHTSDFLISTGISGHTVDFISFFEGTAILSHDIDALLTKLANLRTHTTDFLVSNIPFVFHEADFVLASQALSRLHTTDFITIIRRQLSHTVDFISTYGPDIDVTTGPLIPKWFTRETNMRISSASREFYRTEVYATENGVQIDPTVYSIDFAITANDDNGQEVEPEDDDWVAGSWDSNATVTPPVYYAQVLVGVDTSFPLTNGFYHVWRRINATTEAPVKVVGRLEVT